MKALQTKPGHVQTASYGLRAQCVRRGEKYSLWIPWMITVTVVLQRFYLEPFPKGNSFVIGFCMELLKVSSKQQQQKKNPYKNKNNMWAEKIKVSTKKQMHVHAM